MNHISATNANALQAQRPEPGVLSRGSRHACSALLAASLGLAAVFPALAATALADQPLFSNTSVPGNLALALSVEFPTAISRAHSGSTYTNTSKYLGYFDPDKCYLYKWDASEPLRYFYPAGAAPADRNCGGQTSTQLLDQNAPASGSANFGKWSGNYLNWATMQTIDPFRWALTGGYRVKDTASETIIEKAWAAAQGGEGSNFARKTLTAAQASGATPFPAAITSRIWGLGNILRLTSAGSLDAAGTAYSGPGNVSATTGYEFSVRVKVCDFDTANAGPLEANCVAYGTYYKPEGLMQAYSNRIRYSAFGYLNDSNILRDGAVLRARQKFIGPTRVIPGQPDAVNSAKEWDSATGVFIGDPDPTDSAATASAYGVTVNKSGVMNYLNKFGAESKSYKTYDPVSELYYAAVRYFKNLGNVSAWSDATGATTGTKTTWVDGFPVITNWDDPIQYSCQRNFILGIGDTNSHADKNLPGSTTRTETEPTKPASVNTDPIDSVDATNKVGVLQGIANLGNTAPWTGGNNYNSALMSGIAYNVNTTDIRPDVAVQANTLGKQTIQTYWLDVLESGFASNNQFYLATKYGGFKVPTSWNYATATDAAFFNSNKSLWSTSGDKVGAQDRPDNYYTADRPDLMVAGLTKAFASIAASLKAYTTSFAVALPQLSASGNGSYSTQYDASTWTGEITASELGFDGNGQPTQTQKWVFSSVLAAQSAGAGWDTSRRIVTWNPTLGTGGQGVAFRYANLSAAQKATLNTPYRAGDDGSTYLEYLRGNTSQEIVPTEPYRPRVTLVGDIVGSKAQPVGPPNLPLSDSTNPGYASFRGTYSARPTVVYVGSNDGTVHAINGSLTGPAVGQTVTGSIGGGEIFAYVPAASFSGPNNTPSVDGLAARGNPDFTHKYLVNATPNVYDIDFGRTVGGTGTDWRSVLIGGLGKGGKSFYAIDVSDPAGMTTEAIVAGKVLWEFTDSTMGYSFGDPVVVKTAKYGWVVILTSGYNNADGKGYIYIVNPRTGELLRKISTGTGTVANPAGLTFGNAFIVDRTNGTADSFYAGDLLGNVWRQDLTIIGDTWTAPVQVAALTDGSTAQPITTRPLIEVQPVTNRRFIFVGTGKLLADSDVASTQVQSFYAIVDGTGARFATTLPTGVSYPIGRDKLALNSDLLTGVTFNSTTQMGWYVNLGSGTDGIGWRVVTAPTSFFGTIAFASTLPNGDACNPTGSSRVYPLDFGTGQTKLLSTDNSTFLAISGVVTDLKFVGVDGKDKLVAGTDVGALQDVKRAPTTAPGLRRLNWRELPVIN